MLVLYVGLYASSASFYREGYGAAFEGKPSRVPTQMRVANALNYPAVKVATLLTYIVNLDRVAPTYIPLVTPVLAWGGALAAHHFIVILLLLVMWYLVGRWVDGILVH